MSEVDEAEDAPTRSWLAYAAIGYIAGYVISVLTLGLYAAVSGDTTGLGPIVAAQLGLWFGWGGAAVLASRTAGTGDIRADLGLRVARIDIALGVTVAVLSQFVLVPLVQLPVRLLVHDMSARVDKITGDVLSSAHGWHFLLFGIFIATGAGIVEELYFRGLLQRAIERHAGAWWAIGVTSLLFALTHGHLIEVPALLAFAVVLGVLYHRTQRLILVMIVHATFDFLAVLSYGFSHHLL